MNTQQNYAAGVTIIEEGAMGDCAFIIEQGLVEISIRHEGEKVVLALLSDGDIFGEMALVSGDARSASARALVPTSVSVICRTYFEEKISQTDPIIAMLMKLLLERFHEARSKLLTMPKVCLNTLEESSQTVPELDKKSHREALERFKFINDLQSALARRQFFLNYQPIHVLASGRLAGFEALIRWQHPDKGLIPPDQFIHIAEDTKDIIPIGYWVFANACADIKRLREAQGVGGDAGEPWVSINVSPVQIKDTNLPARFEEILADCGMEPGSIKIELTESVLVDDPQMALLFIREVKRLGMRVAIDDFGTGYSSLSYLHLFPIDILKIDRSFVANLFVDDRCRQIVNAIVALAKNLNIEIVAEGVETEALKELLFQLGCRYGQGYLYSRPLSLEKALALSLSQPSPLAA